MKRPLQRICVFALFSLALMCAPAFAAQTATPAKTGSVPAKADPAPAAATGAQAAASPTAQVAAAPAAQTPAAQTPAAQAPAAQAPAAQAPAAPAKSATPVAVELEGTDTIGAKLAFQLKEIFNTSSLFGLSDKEQPKIRLLISTAPEFPSRPTVGSVYCVVWVYYERATSFNSYLAREIGTVTMDEVPALAARLAERTSGLAAKYSYIFD